MIENLIALGLLILLQAVLGFDNRLYISIESKRAPAEHQRKVRQWGIGLAIVLRIVLLFVVMNAIQLFQDELFHFDLFGITDPNDVWRQDALDWSTTRGSRSGRVAWQYVQDYAGRNGVRLS